MGSEFKDKTRKSFDKCWDKAAVDANTPTLFSKSASHAPNLYEAEAIGQAAFTVGDTINLRLEGDALIGRRDHSPVLKISSPSPDLIKSVREGCNVARADVVTTDPISGVLEVTIS